MICKDNGVRCVFQSYVTGNYFGRLTVDLNGIVGAKRIVFLYSKICD